MDGFNKLIMVIADALPLEIIVEKLQEGLSKYTETNDDDDLAFACTLFLTKKVTTNEGLTNTIESLNHAEKIKKILDTDPLKS
jgi:hypothetical protein